MTEQMTSETAVPTADLRTILGSVKAALIGYASTVAGGVVATILIVIAVALGSDSSSSEVGVTQEDTTAFGFLVGLPFQLAGMSLFGTLSIGSGEFSASVSMLPLTLTAIFCFVTFVCGSRAERSQPATGRFDRLVSSVIAGVVAAAVVLVATLVFAMRYDGTTTHSAGVGLFFGTLLLGTASVQLGRMRASGARVPPAGVEYAAAARLWLQQVALWSVVFLPVAFVWIVVEDSFALALTLPIWGFNMAGFGYTLGHLSPVSAGNEYAAAWEMGALTATALITLAVVVSVLAAMAWHLRRAATPERLRDPMSWLPLPAAWATGGLLMCLVLTVRGDVLFVGGSVGPAFFAFFILAIWALLIEAVSRHVAPALVAPLPPRARTFLTGRLALEGATPGSQDRDPAAPPAPRAPLTPEEKKRLRRILVGVAALVGVGVAGLVAVSVLNATVYSPKHDAKAYLDAIVRGDVEGALSHGAVSREDGSYALLTDEILDQASARITGYEITDLETDGDSAEVSVTLEGLDEGTEATFSLQKSGSRALLLDKWTIADGGLMKPVQFQMPEGSTELSIGQTTVSVDSDGSYWLLPGTYELNPYGDSPWISVEGAGAVVSPEDAYISLDLPEPSPSDALQAEIARQLDTYLAQCIASRKGSPEGCPNQTYIGTDVRNVKWTLTTAPTAELDYFDGTFPASLQFSEGAATVTYEQDESYGFGAPEWTKQTESTDLYFRGSVDIEGEAVKVSFDE